MVPHTNQEIDSYTALPELCLSQVVCRHIGSHTELPLRQAGFYPRLLEVGADTCPPEIC